MTTLIGAKRDCLLELRAVAQGPLDSAGDRDGGDLMTVLAGKRQLLARLRSIEQALDPFRRQQPQRRSWPTDADRRQCSALLDECDALWQEIVAAEAAATSMAQVGNRMSGTAQAKDTAASLAARAAYAVHSSEGARQLDLDRTEEYES
ncbi:MAG: hypothetical protein HYX69_02265 [Planctomycetia bacterium]|nr:hypothetical protein [Planctomycetia bacterium]